MRRFRRDYFFAVAMCALILFLLASSAAAGTIYVKWDSPGPVFDGASWDTAYHSVQQGLDAAASGDEVWVARGTYVERITLKDGVALLGGFAGVGDTRDIETYVTILDGNKAGSVVVSSQGIGASTQIEGFTIRNGTRDPSPFRGLGGVYCESSSPTISSNVICDNDGGAVFCWGACYPLICSNTITRNRSSVWRAAIYSYESAPLIHNNRITANKCDAIKCYESPAVITNNLIAGNVVVFGAIVCIHASPSITNNTIAENQSWIGGGAMYCYFSSPVVQNNVIAYNSSGVAVYPYMPILANNCVFGNDLFDYYGVSPGDGDIASDPLFVNRPGLDFHLRWDSSCVDAGTNEAAPPTDIEGNPRPVDGDWDGIAVTDIGAYEYAPIQVTIDVLPGDSPNIIALQPNRMITVAVLSDPAFDARNIDPLSVRFGPGLAGEAHHRGHWEDVNRDGMIDLLLHFRCGETGIQPGDTSVTLFGRLNDGEPFTGTAKIKVLVPQGRK